MYKIQHDKYQKARGGSSRMLEVSCEGCGSHVAYYQKDGPGILKRMYVDRLVDIQTVEDNLACSDCGRVLANLINYKKEDRLAYRLYVGAVTKKIVRKDSIQQR